MDTKRKEQIFEYLKERNIPIISLEANSIMEGIMWSDEHPKSEMVNKQEFIERTCKLLYNNWKGEDFYMTDIIEGLRKDLEE